MYMKTPPPQLDSDFMIIRLLDKVFIPNDPENRDWIEYQKWLNESEDNVLQEWDENLYNS